MIDDVYLGAGTGIELEVLAAIDLVAVFLSIERSQVKSFPVGTLLVLRVGGVTGSRTAIGGV